MCTLPSAKPRSYLNCYQSAQIAVYGTCLGTPGASVYTLSLSKAFDKEISKP